MDTFHRVEFTGSWRRLFSRVKKHVIWGVLKSFTGMQVRNLIGTLVNLQSNFLTLNLLLLLNLPVSVPSICWITTGRFLMLHFIMNYDNNCSSSLFFFKYPFPTYIRHGTGYALQIYEKFELTHIEHVPCLRLTLNPRGQCRSLIYLLLPICNKVWSAKLLTFL